MLQKTLENALVAEAICKVDHTGAKYLANPYASQPTATAAAIAGTYSLTAWTSTDDTITVGDQATYGEHIYQFEEALTRFDIYRDRIERMTYAVALTTDQFVLNKILDQASGSYTTAAGGFATAGNVNKIIADLSAKVMGYAQSFMNGLFVVLEDTDVSGVMQAQMTNGFSFADRHLNNGFMSNYGNVEIYVVRTGTFQTATIGTLSAVNDGRRLFGVKNTAVFLNPQGIQYEEKKVTLKTGKEVAVFNNYAAGIWNNDTALFVDILLA